MARWVRRATARLGVVVLAVSALALAGPVGIASAAAPTSITISPASANGVPGTPQSYTAADQDGTDVTAGTTFAITPDGTCAANSCTPAKPGQHTVTATNGTATATATLRVPDRLPVSGSDSYATTAGTTLDVAAPGVLANDTDADGDPLTAAVAATPGNGTLTLNPDGSFRYVPNAGYEGTDRFTYRANDGRTNGTGNAATVTIIVGAAPTESLTVSPASATVGVGSPQTYTATQNGADVTAATTFTIEPDGSCAANVCTPTAPGEHLVVGRKGAAFDTAALTASNRLPTAAADSYTVESGTVLTVPAPGVLANDSDPDAGTTLTALAFRQPTHGVLVLSPNGSFVYTPEAGYTGPDSFTYRARDGQPQGASEPVAVSLTVTPANRAPVAAADSYSTPFQTALTVPAPGVLGNDTDPDAGTTLTTQAVTPTAHGTVTLRPDGSFTYVPAAGYSGPDAFTYTASDGRLASASATVTLTVAGPAGPARADISVAVTAQPAVVGRPFPVTVTTRNDGPFAAAQVLTTLRLPAGLRAAPAAGTLVSPDGRSVVTYSASVPAARSVTSTITVVAAPSARGTQTLGAGVIARTPDPNLRNNAATTRVTVGR